MTAKDHQHGAAQGCLTASNNDLHPSTSSTRRSSPFQHSNLATDDSPLSSMGLDTVDDNLTNTFGNLAPRDAGNTVSSNCTTKTPNPIPIPQSSNTTSSYPEHIDLLTTFYNKASSPRSLRNSVAESIGEDRTSQSHSRRVNAPTRPFPDTNHDRGPEQMPDEPPPKGAVFLNNHSRDQLLEHGAYLKSEKSLKAWMESSRQDYCKSSDESDEGWDLLSNEAWVAETPNSNTTPQSPANTTQFTEDEYNNDLKALNNLLRAPQRVNCDEMHISLLPSRLEPLCRAYGISLIQFYINWRSARDNAELKLLLIDLIVAAIEGIKKINLGIDPFPPTPASLNQRVDAIESSPFDGFQDHPGNFTISHAIISGPNLSHMTLRMVVIGTVKLHPGALQEMFWAATDDEERLMQSAGVCGKMIGDVIGYKFLESANLIKLVEGWLALWNQMDQINKLEQEGMLPSASKWIWLGRDMPV
ncbi:hypothetical protein ACJZ2D_014946 [Fusarium nematophilum]